MRRINIVREITATAPISPERGERYDHCDYPDGRVLLLGPPDCYLNHSCDPNAYILYERSTSYLVARRDILAGEEITIDYAMNLTGGDSWPCNCGAARCRQVVRGDFFSLPCSLQREYAPLLAPWFVRDHQDELKDLFQQTVNDG